MKPLPPATERDVYDQFWYGDPYSNATPHDQRDISKADTLLRRMTFFNVDSIGFDFVEIQRKKENGYIVEQLSPNPSDPSRNHSALTTAPVSRFSVGWEDISKPGDRKFWVAGSRLSIIDLTDDTVVAERIGYLIETGRLFILKALTPLKE